MTRGRGGGGRLPPHCTEPKSDSPATVVGTHRQHPHLDGRGTECLPAAATPHGAVTGLAYESGRRAPATPAALASHTPGPSLPRLLARTARRTSHGPRPWTEVGVGEGADPVVGAADLSRDCRIRSPTARDEGEEERHCCRYRCHAGGGALDQLSLEPHPPPRHQDRRGSSPHGGARGASREFLTATILEGRAGLLAVLSGSSEVREDEVEVRRRRLGFAVAESPVRCDGNGTVQPNLDGYNIRNNFTMHLYMENYF
jgi:hypothetical protein